MNVCHRRITPWSISRGGPVGPPAREWMFMRSDRVSSSYAEVLSTAQPPQRAWLCCVAPRSVPRQPVRRRSRSTTTKLKPGRACCPVRLSSQAGNGWQLDAWFSRQRPETMKFTLAWTLWSIMLLWNREARLLPCSCSSFTAESLKLQGRFQDLVPRTSPAAVVYCGQPPPAASSRSRAGPMRFRIPFHHQGRPRSTTLKIQKIIDGGLSP